MLINYFNSYQSGICLIEQHSTCELIEKLYKLVQDARYIIIMNNNLSDLNIKWIKVLHKDIPFSIIHNTYQP